jgi:hypothetical protein
VDKLIEFWSPTIQNPSHNTTIENKYYNNNSKYFKYILFIIHIILLIEMLSKY